MQKQRQLSLWLVAVAALAAAPEAPAIGWGRAPQTAVLGQALDFPVSLRLDPGDSVEPRCVNAEVTVGDTRLPAPSVRVGVDTSSPEQLGIRVLTGVAIDEPVVTVTLSIGCPVRLSRRFVLLADPPALAASALPLAPIAPVTPVTTVATASTAPVAPASAAPAAPASAPLAATDRTPTPRADTAPPPPRPRSEAPRKPTVRKPAPKPAENAPVARLRLDAAEPVRSTTPAAAAAASAAQAAVEEALQAVSQAASAARAAASAASAAEARVATLEQTVNQLRAETNAGRDTIAQLRARLAEADRGSRWTLPLGVAVLGLLALALWMALRLRRIDAERVRAWRAAAAAQAERPATPTSQLPMVTTEIPLPPPATQPSVVAAPPPPVQPPLQAPAERDLDIALDSTDVLPVGSVADAGSPRDVTIEELLDLEQQAEFFIVLGQDDAAVDLLVHHLRDTGGGSPLPYLKLLEIYRRRGEREAYERTRSRFNHRFNAFAPGWDADLQAGRSLEDYKGVLPRLLQVWPRPMDAMAELEALLFRRSRGELFELPAYREVLFLYSLARDLLDREAAESGNVDLLLPLADGGEFSSTAPHPYLQVERDSVFDPGITLDRPTAPIDLDLTQPGDGGPDSIVQPLNPKG